MWRLFDVLELSHFLDTEVIYAVYYFGRCEFAQGTEEGWPREEAMEHVVFKKK